MEFIWLVKDNVTGIKSCPGIIGTDCNGSFVDIKKFPEIMRLAFEFEIFHIFKIVQCDDRINVDGMNFAGSYMVPEYASNDAIKDKVDCVEIPTFNGKEDNCINGLGYAVFEGSKNKEAAEDFAIWLGSKEAQEIQGKTGVVISARTDAQKCFAEANSQYNLAAYTNHADEAYPLPVCAKAAELYDLEATELQKAYNGEKSLSDVCKGLTKQADKLLQE